MGSTSLSCVILWRAAANTFKGPVSPVYGHHTGWNVIVDADRNRSPRYVSSRHFASAPRAHGGLENEPCVVMFAGVWFALTFTSAVSAQEAVDQNKAVAEADQHKAAAKAEDTDTAEADASERERTQSTDAEELAAIETDARIVPIKPESPQVQQVCRKISVTGTRFTQRECRTVEQWAEVDARRSAQGRRVMRDVQSQSSVIGAPGPGTDTPESRQSGLPNPAATGL
jgi:hypothetical protein